MYTVEVTPVVGLPQFTGWSHVSTNHSRFGHLVCAFAVNGEHAGNVGRDLTQLITDFSVNSATDVHELLTKLTQTAESMDTTLAIAAGFFTANTMVIGAVRGSIFLKREQRMGVLMTANAEVKIVEGKRKVGDTVVLSTSQGQSLLPEVEQRFKTGYDADSVIASIIPSLHTHHDSSLSSLAFVTGGKEVEEVVTTEAPLEIELGDETQAEVQSEATPAMQAEITTETTVEQPVIDATNVPTFESSQVSPVAPTTMVPMVVPSTQSSWKKMLEKVKQVPVKKIVFKFANVIKLFFVGLKEMMVAVITWLLTSIRRLRSNEVYVDGQSPRKIVQMLVPAVVGILVVGGLILWWLLTTRSQVKAAEAALAPQRELLTAARETLNTNPIKAREDVQIVIGNLEQLQTEFTQRKAGQKVITKQLEEAKAFYEDISGLEAVQELEIFYDIRLVDSGFLTSQVDAYGDTAVFLDRDRKKAVMLSISTKQAQLLSLDQMDRVMAVAVDDKNITFLGNGLFQTPLDPVSVTRAIDEGDSNRSGTALETFASYVYVFNPEKRNIYRYSKGEDAFSDPIGWVSGAVQFDFNTVNSWAIDGQVWIGAKDGNVHLLESGSEQTFEIKGLNKPFEHPLVLFTRDGFTNLYVLEANTQRLVVLAKDGSFIKEVSSPSLASATGLFVDEASNTAYAVSGTIVYAVKL